MVDAAEVFELPFFVPADEVARAVHPPAGGVEGIGDETFGARAGPAEVTPRETAAQVELAGHAGRAEIEVRVEHARLPVPDRLADGHVRRGESLARQRYADGRGDDGLGRAVAVDDARRLQHRLHEVEVGARHRLAADRVGPDRQPAAGLAEQLGHLRQVARREAGDGDAVAFDLGGGAFHRPQLLVTRHERGTEGQRHPGALVRAVEGDGRELQFAVGRRHAVDLADRLHVHRQRAVRDRHALGTAGRSRGVDDVGQVLRVDLDGGIRLGAGEGVRAVQRQHREALRRRQPRREGLLRQQQPDAAVLDHVGQPIGRIGRVQRHVGRAGLEDGKQRHHHVHRPLHGQADAVLGADAERDQAMRQAVGAGIELRIAELLVAEEERHRIRALDGLALDKAGHRRRAVEARHRDAPAGQLRAGGVAHHVQLAQGLPGSMRQGIDQAGHRGVHQRADLAGIQRFMHLRNEAEAFTVVIHRQAEGIVRAFLGGIDLHAVPGGGGRVAASVGVPVVEQRREQRRATRQSAAALRQRQAGVLMTQQRGQRRVGVAQPLRDGPLADPQAQRQRVDGQAQRARRAVVVDLQAAEQHGAEDHVGPAARAAQHQGPGEMEQRRDAHALLTRHATRLAGQRGGQCQSRLAQPRSVAAHIRQAEGHGGFGHVAQHRAEEGLVLGAADAEAGVRDEAPERHRRGQLGLAILLDQRDLLDDAGQRAVVGHQVVAGQLQQPATAAGVEAGHGAQQRRAPYVDAAGAGSAQRLEALGHGAFRWRDPGDVQAGLAAHDLQRFVQPLPQDRGAQDVVARDDAIEAVDEPAQPRLAVEADQVRGHIGVGVALQQVVEEDAFLQRRQRVNVLDVGRAAGNRRFDAADRGRVEVDQGEHLRMDLGAVLGDAVGRHDDVERRRVG